MATLNKEHENESIVTMATLNKENEIESLGNNGNSPRLKPFRYHSITNILRRNCSGSLL